MKRACLRILSIAALATGQTACSPALNWRAVQVEQLQAMLPCKPDQAQRPVHLGTRDVTMQMSGCEAAGALYAISHVRVGDALQASTARADWRAATLANLRAGSVQSQTLPWARPGVGSTASGTAGVATHPRLEILAVQGQGPDGKTVQARLAWISRGADLYQVAVYGPQLNDAMLEMLFSDLRLP